jgi:hypothetical protein
MKLAQLPIEPAAYIRNRASYSFDL